MIYNIPYLAVVALLAIGLWATIFRKNLIKVIIGITIIESGVNFFLIALGYRSGAYAPIYTYAPSERMVLPVPQALTLTSIVIGVAVLALMLSLAVQIYKKQGTLDTRKGVLRK
jgi:multicomponent Na+:H+ antiporter subunit C